MQPPAEPGLRELAARLLNSRRGRRWDQEATPQVQLLPGQIAPDLPLTLPTAADSRIIGSLLHTAEGETNAWTVVLDMPGTPADLLAHWKTALGEQGWQPFEGHRMLELPDSGFQADFNNWAGANRPPTDLPPEIQAQIARQQATASTQQLFCATAAGGSLNLTLTPQPDGPTMVRLDLDREGLGPCQMQEQLQESIATRLPRLLPPEGVILMPAGGGGSKDRWSSEATAMTDQPVSALEAHFAAQLTAAGWTRQAGHAADPLAWSLWTVPGDPTAQGFFYARSAPSPDKRYLVVQIETAQDQGMGTTFGRSIIMHSRSRGHSREWEAQHTPTDPAS
ncbi:MAG: hypothetical protein M3Z04_19680 [Chloroflexota bacterium]|nr:hypothetical protein [Chloroflexota bacterium]